MNGIRKKEFPNRVEIKKQVDILLDWSHKQGRILTANGKALEYYVKERGFPFQDSELPHFHLLSGDSYPTFYAWAQADNKRRRDDSSFDFTSKYIVGAWARRLFVGGWEHTTDADEITFNLQTHGLFIDIRIPRMAKDLIDFHPISKSSFFFDEDSSCNIFQSWSKQQLQRYARRHAFAGYTRIQEEPQSQRLLCTRSHCIDWNFVGVPRSRPNKWYVEMHPDHRNIWKEWSFAKDYYGQHYYFEQWERLDGDDYGKGIVLALRQTKIDTIDVAWRDGILVVIGDHFSIIQGRRHSSREHHTYSKNNVVDLIDASLDNGNQDTVDYYLSIVAAHGRVSNGWIVDCSIQYWKEGTQLWDPYCISVQGSSIETCKVCIHDTEWHVYESSIHDTRALESFLKSTSTSNVSRCSKL